MTGGMPGSVSASHHGVEFVFSGLPMPFFNIGLPAGPIATADELDSMARASVEWAAPRALPWLLVTTSENISADIPVAEILERHGLAPAMTLTGMLAGDVNPPTQLPDGFALNVPGDDAACAQIIHLNQAAYGMDMQCLLPYIGTSSFWQKAAGVIGTLGETPVSCSTVLPVDGYHYVALVATHPDHRRRGYADAAMRQSLAVATGRFGVRPTFLHATDAGRPVYELMGYKPVASHVMYIEQKFLTAH